MNGKLGGKVKMAEFRLWGRVEFLGATEFSATATAVPENGDPSEVRSLTQTLPSREAAGEALERLMARMDAIVREAGGIVTQTQVESG